MTISFKVFAIFGFLWHHLTILLPFHLITLIALLHSTLLHSYPVHVPLKKNGYPPSKSGRFSVNLYPIVRRIFHPICIINLLELMTKVFIFVSRTWFCSTNKPISIHYLWKCDWTIMIFHQFDVGHNQFYPWMFLKDLASTIFLLQLKPKNGFKLKTGFDFRRSVSVRLTYWLQL